jgi:tol-pal system protein YbgF
MGAMRPGLEQMNLQSSHAYTGRWRGRAALLVLMLGSTQALADDAANKPIQQIEARLDALETRMDKLGELLKNQGLLSLLQEVSSLSDEVSRLKGQIDVNVHDLDTQGKRQTDLYQDLDRRLTDLATQDKQQTDLYQSLDRRLTELASRAPQVATPSTPPAPAPKLAEVKQQHATAAASANTSPSAGQNASSAATVQAAAQQPAAQASDEPDPLAETKAYEAALNYFRAADYQGAVAAFKSFYKTYPRSTLAANALYWSGYSYYAMGSYKAALTQQQKLLEDFPTSNKVPDAMLNLARCQEELKELPAAKKTLQELIAKYSGTNAAAIGSKRLASLN